MHKTAAHLSFRFFLWLFLACLAGCATNPVTGRDQIVSVPAAQVHADIGFALSTGARRIVLPQPCGQTCRDEDTLAKFIARVRSIVRQHAFPIPAQRTTIDFATLGGDAGFIGAAGIARLDFHRQERKIR